MPPYIVQNLCTRYNEKHPSHGVEARKFILTLPTKLVTSFFTPTLEKIAECLREIKDDSDLEDLYRVYIVGGFSRSPLLRDKVRAALGHPGYSIVQVHEPDTAIVKGAVMYFERSTVFNSRKAKLTYGVSQSVPFLESDVEHQRRRKAGRTFETDENGLYLGGVFGAHIKAGDDVPTGGVCAQIDYFPLLKSQKTMTSKVYASPDKNPTFVDEDGCFEVGRVTFELDTKPKTLKERGYRVEFIFGGPELTVKILHLTEEREIADAVMIMSRAPSSFWKGSRRLPS